MDFQWVMGMKKGQPRMRLSPCAGEGTRTHTLAHQILRKKELDYSASLTEDLSADEKKTLKALETVTGAGNIGDNGAGSHLPHAEPAGTNDAAERDGQKNKAAGRDRVAVDVQQEREDLHVVLLDDAAD